MRKSIDPRQVGLHPSTRLEQTGKNRFVILIDRKSRIVMKDGKNLMHKINKIRVTFPKAEVDIETTAPVCGKTLKYLEEQNIKLQQK